MRYLLLLTLTDVNLVTAAWTPSSQRVNSLAQYYTRPQFRSRPRNHSNKSHRVPSIRPTCRYMAEEEDNESIQNEIDQMKLEALKKLNDLDYKMSSSASFEKGSETESIEVSKSTDNAALERISVRTNPSASIPRDPILDSLTLLSDTSWKISFNVGRERG